MYLVFLNKEEILEKIRNFKFFNQELRLKSEAGFGCGQTISDFKKIFKEYYEEKVIVYKLKLIESVLKKSGDDAINQYEQLTKYPDKSHSLYQGFESFFGDDEEFMKVLDETFVPMKKEEFEVYLEIYNELILKPINQ